MKNENSYLVFFYPYTKNEDGKGYNFSIISQLEFDFVGNGYMKNFSVRDLHLYKMWIEVKDNPVIDFKTPILIKKTPSIQEAIDSIKEYMNVVDSYSWGQMFPIK